MPTFKTVTLGCKVNQYETEYVREGLLRLGYRSAEEDEPADLCVVNTCTVTGEGDLKSRKIVRQLARGNPGAEIVVMGCYATRAPEEVAALPGVVEVLTDKRQLPDFFARRGLIDIPSGISSFGTRHRAYVKVQDGCRLRCSYCIIPSVRPVLASRTVEEVLDEVRRLVEGGYREIVLTGIHLGHYGVDLRKHRQGGPRVNLACLLRRIAALDGGFRVRLSSLEAVEVTPELIAVIAGWPDRICPHLHISMQSGSDAVLARMRRRYTAGRFVEQCRQIRQSLDRPALTTDIIVGFPGETDVDFEATCRTAEEIGFSKIHVFRFSPRRGTPAAAMPEQVPSHVAQQRSGELAKLGNLLRRQYFESLLGREMQVLVESPQRKRPGFLVGTSERYVPVELAGASDDLGRLVRRKAESLAGEHVVAKDTA
ncbi:MAG: tRNA (N(6)-L-threonylcarbamoyladenosine(37)-C(2))-methylthiotransferase MtaB [Pirellulales bacterium]|nr:tRNA (N(6)-L-threonylcarbamoyladenosine(37)-C(2))-methylthiotransferase MtaB [Pirellulales bacterium]